MYDDIVNKINTCNYKMCFQVGTRRSTDRRISEFLRRDQTRSSVEEVEHIA